MRTITDDDLFSPNEESAYDKTCDITKSLINFYKDICYAPYYPTLPHCDVSKELDRKESKLHTEQYREQTKFERRAEKSAQSDTRQIAMTKLQSSNAKG